MSITNLLHRAGRALGCCLLLIAFIADAGAGSLPNKNISVLGPTPPGTWYAGDTFMQFNEADGACSPNNPLWCAVGMNDYSGVNNPALGDAYQRIAMTRTGGDTWISGMHPGHLVDSPSIGKQFAADPNLEAVPGMLFFNYIAGWRDGSQPGGVYVGRWYERNTESGPPWQFLDNKEVSLGTPGRFLDKPGYKVAYKDPSEPPIVVNIPALPNPDPAAPPEQAVLHDAFELSMPAFRMHLCYAVFVGNDNNDGTKIECTYSDDAGETWSGRTKLTESTEINQGVSLATRNFGQDVLACWLRFKDNNEDNSLVCAFSTDGAASFSKPTVVTDFCPFNQPTGPARHRSNALPVVVSNGDEFAVYFSSRNLPVRNGDNACVTPGKGNKPPVEKMSNVALIDDFDSFGETPDPATGARVRDGLVRTSRNFSRIVMMRSANPANANAWSQAVAVDADLRSDVPECQGAGIACRKNYQQYMPAAFVADGIETLAWYDSRMDRLNRLPNPITSAFVDDVIVNLQSETCDAVTGLCTPPWTKATLLPAELYELEPPPAGIPEPGNNIALRRNLDVFAAQIVNGMARPYLVDPDNYYPDADVSNGVTSPSVRVTRFTTRIKRNADGSVVYDPVSGLPVREQAQFNFPNARMFRKGTRPFIGDYNTVFAINARLQDGVWTSNQAPLASPEAAPGTYFPALEPTFHIGWTTNRDVRGKVFYTGCDVWNEAEQRWEAGEGTQCASDYATPDAPPAAMLPLQGEDGGQASAPGVCSVEVGSINSLLNSYTGPLTRNQKIYTARLEPGLHVELVSAVKTRADGLGGGAPLNTFVIAMQNGSGFARRVRLEVAPGETGVSFERRTFVPDEGAATLPALLYIDVVVPAGSSNFRTLLDAAGDLLDDNIVIEAYDVTSIGIFDADGNPLPDSVPGTGDLSARLSLSRQSVQPLEALATVDPATGLPIDVTTEDYFRLLLERETAATKTLEFENLEFENLEFQNLEFQNLAKLLEFENSAELLEFENLEFQNTFLFLEFENLEFENIVVDNSSLADDSYSVLDLDAATLAQLEFENTSVELLEFQNLEFENLEFQNRTLAEDLEFLEFENTFLEMLEFENTSGEYLEFENLEFENLEFQNSNFDFSSEEFLEFQNATTANLEFENTPFFSSAVDNPDLGNVTIDQSFIGSESVSVSWEANSSGNTTTGVDLKPIFSPALVEALDDAGTQVILSVREFYLRPTVSLTGNESTGAFCSVQVIAQNQVVYSAVLSASQINSLFDDPEAGDAFAAGFRLDPYTTKVITLQLIGPPSDFDTVPELSAAAGMAIFAQGAHGSVLCEENSEAQDEVFDACEIDLPVFDNTPPVITLAGANPQTVEVTQTGSYSDPGATAEDETDGDLTADITVTGDVDVSVVGSYARTYTVADDAGNVTEVVRTVNVVDTTAPTITAPADINTEATGPLTAVAIGTASASDNSGNVSVTNDAPAAGFGLGTTVVTWTATDGAGLTAQATQSITVVDTTPPSVAPNTVIVDGVAVIDFELEAGDTYVEPGATATDLVDPAPAVTVSGSVDTSLPGTYIITYTAIDGSGNLGTATRTVTVVDTGAPVLDFPPTFSETLPFVVNFDESSFSLEWMFDVSDADSRITVSCDISAVDDPGTVVATLDPLATDPVYEFGYDFEVGTTLVTCSAEDASGNVGTGSFEVEVFDETPPVITLIADPLIVTTLAATAVVDIPGNVSAFDVVSGDVLAACTLDAGADGDPRTISGPVELAVGTEGTASCTATDGSGNEASTSFGVEVLFALGIQIVEPKGNIRAGSGVPIDWYYLDRDTGAKVDSASLMPLVEWFGPFPNRDGCSSDATGSNSGSTAADDAGNSDFRYNRADRRWRLNWATPSAAGYYRVVITPPGTDEGTFCVRLR